ncbi:MAG TPA: hypothetical protein VF235_01170, partial [Actinomycetota bacterium]
MKTTLNLDEALLREAKKKAAEDGTTLTHVVEQGLRAVLRDEEPPAAPYVFRFPTIAGGVPMFDVADRDALYDLFDGRT